FGLDKPSPTGLKEQGFGRKANFNWKEVALMAQEAKIFKYQTPEFEGVKKSMIVCNSDLMKVMVQVVEDGGENNLHTHTGDDAFWYVLSGAVKFYGEGDKLIG